MWDHTMVVVEVNGAPMVEVVCGHNKLSVRVADEEEEQLIGDLGGVQLPAHRNFNIVVWKIVEKSFTNVHTMQAP